MKPGYLPDSDEFLTVEDALRFITKWMDHPAMRQSVLNANPALIASRSMREQNEQALREAYESGTLTLQDEESMRVGNPSMHQESTRQRVTAKINSSPLAAIAATLWISFADFNRFAKPRVTYSYTRDGLVEDDKIWFRDVENQLGYTIRGAAGALAAKYSISADAMARRIFEAAEREKLEVRDPQTGMRYIPKERAYNHERISVFDLNQWLEDSGAPYRLGEESVASTSPTAATGRQDIDRDMVMQIFSVRPSAIQNRQFWDDKLGRPPVWLRGARTLVGKPGISSRWNPLLVAHALLDGGYMNVRQLDSAIHQHIPELLERWKEETDDHR